MFFIPFFMSKIYLILGMLLFKRILLIGFLFTVLNQLSAQNRVLGYYDDTLQIPTKLYYEGELTADSLREGHWLYYYPDGALWQDLNFLKGEYHGEQVVYYSNGLLSQYCRYENGQENGSWLEFFSNGDTSTIGEFVDANEEGVWRDYYIGGQLLKEGRYHAGLKEGLWVEYYPTDTIQFIAEYTQDTLNGSFIGFYPNGKAEYEVEYKHGLMNGPYTEYYFNGEVSINAFYYYGKELGYWESFYSNNQIQAKGYYVDGIKDSTWSYFYHGGVQKQTEEYRLGELYNVSSTADFKGGKHNSGSFKEGFGTRIYFDSIARKVAEVPFVNGVEEGVGFSFNPKSGKKSASSNYKDGFLHGVTTEYYSSGNVSAQINYEFHEEQGRYLEFFENGDTLTFGYYKNGLEDS